MEEGTSEEGEEEEEGSEDSAEIIGGELDLDLCLLSVLP
jgi:hypothetical protein